MEVNFGILICCFTLMCSIFEQKFSACAQKGELNYPCTTTGDCRSFGYVCRENTCKCDQWYIPDKEKKTCVGGVDQKCLYDEHCIEGAYCMHQSVCKCKHSSSQPLENGLVCGSGGVADLKQHRSIRLTFLGIGVIITNIFGGTCT